MKNNSIDSSKIKILICCHKKSELPQNPDNIFLPIHVGAAISEQILDMQRDDEANGHPCDNISHKNKSYCELTAIYWAWKNIKNIYPKIEYIGLNHYRRFFSFDKNILFKPYIATKENEISKYNIAINKIIKSLREGRWVVSKKEQFAYSVYLQYSLNHYSEDLKTLREVIKKLYPEYNQSFGDIFENNNSLSLFNMFIMKYEDFEKYCKWLFSILEECEKAIPCQNYTTFQKRVFGYLAERLFNVYVYHNNIKTLKKTIIWYTNDKNKNIFSRFSYYIRSNLSFILQKTLSQNIKICIKKIMKSVFMYKK